VSRSVELSPELEALIGPPSELPHLPQALTHPSFANEQKASGGPSTDYQRLEFLGDAVLGFVVSEELIARFPDAREGELSRLRAHVVSTEALAGFAREIGLGRSLFLGRGASAARDREQTSVLADAVEAVIAAVHLDKGLHAAREMIGAIVVRGLASPRPVRDAKSELQERVQAEGEAAPVYRVVSVDGPHHARTFVVEVALARGLSAEGRGGSKRVAEQEAARAALDRLDDESAG
jgi:ribonuclease-3